MAESCFNDDHPQWTSTKTGGFRFGELTVMLCAVILSNYAGSLGHAYTYGLALLILALGFNVNISPGLIEIAPDILAWLTTIGAGALVEASGGCEVFEGVMYRLFKKAKILIAPIFGVIGVVVAGVCGTDSVCLLFFPPAISLSKRVGLRPSKPLSALVVGGMLGAAASPYNPFIRSARGAANVSFTEGLSISLIGAVVGAFCAGFVASFLGHDLHKSGIYTRRLELGMVENEYTDKTIAVKSAEPVRSVYHTKLEQKYSMQSVLSEGDYLFTEGPQNRDNSYIDISDRVGIVKNTTSSPARTQAAYATTTTLEVVQERSAKKPVSSAHAWTAVTLYCLAAACACTWCVLRTVPEDSDPEVERQPMSEYAYMVAVLGTSAIGAFLLRKYLRPLFSRGGSAASRSPIVRAGFVGLLPGVLVSLLGYSYMLEWKSTVGCLFQHGDGWVWLVWLGLTSLLANFPAATFGMTTSLGVPSSNYKGTAANPAAKWYAAALPLSTTNWILPIHPNMIAAAELDDTGTTKLGTFLVDHVFFVPGLVGYAVAVALSYAFALLFID